jgi:hypothetical protein
MNMCFVLTNQHHKAMDYELKQSIVGSWNEADELNHSLSNLTDAEIIQCKDALIERTKKIMDLLGQHISEDDVQEYLNL